MSPEQARGKPVDKRTDIWAFGCVLYEMLTGRAAFSGDTVADTIARVLEREPDWTALPRHHARADPQSAARMSGQGFPRTTAGHRRRRSRSTAFCLAHCCAPTLLQQRDARRRRASGLAAVGASPRSLPGRGSLWRWSLRPAPAAASQSLTSRASCRPGARRQRRRAHRDAVARRHTAGLRRVASPPLPPADQQQRPGGEADPGTEKYKGVREPAFSPDGKEIAFYAFADRTLKRMPVAGGGADDHLSMPRRPPASTGGATASCCSVRDETASGGRRRTRRTAKQIADVEADEEAHGPQLLPDGDHFLFTIATGRARDRWDKAQIVVQSLSNRQAQRSCNLTGSDARYVPPGYLVYAVGGQRLRRPVRSRTVSKVHRHRRARVRTASAARGGGHRRRQLQRVRQRHVRLRSRTGAVCTSSDGHRR